jgi:predicted DsbA family dithiol-disulfide isomerase
MARRLGVPIKLPTVSPQPHTHLAFEGFQYAKEYGKGNDYNHRVLEAIFVEGQDIGQIDVLTKLPARSGWTRRSSGRRYAPASTGRRTNGGCGTPMKRPA